MKVQMRCGAVMAIALLGAGRALAAPDANAIMKKAQGYLSGAKTYQGTWVMTIGMGTMGTMAVNMDMKMIPSQGKLAMQMTPAGQATGQMAMAGAMMNMQSVDDGKNLYTYMPIMGGYQKGPHNSQISMDPRKQFMQQAEYAKFRYLRMEKLAGQDTHVIEMIADMKKASEAAEKRMGRKMPVPMGQAPMKSEIYVDAATNRLKQMVIHMDLGSAMGAAGGANAKPGAAPSMKMDMTMAVKREILNAPIPDSAFKFTPPAGAKLIPGKPGAGGFAMPGMGGMGGGTGRPRAPR